MKYAIFELPIYSRSWFFFLINAENCIKMSRMASARSRLNKSVKPDKLIVYKNVQSFYKFVSFFKLKTTYNAFLFFFTFKHNYFKTIVSKYSLKFLKHKTSSYFKNFAHSFYFSNVKKLLKTDVVLTGKILSNLNWDFIHKKRWNRDEPQTSLKFNQTPRPVLTGLPVLTLKNFKKFYINNFFYLSKLPLTYNQLKFRCKLDVFQTRPHAFNWQFTKPHLFLASAARSENPTPAIFDLFKNYHKMFSFFRKTFYKTTPNLFFYRPNLNLKSSRTRPFQYLNKEKSKKSNFLTMLNGSFAVKKILKSDSSLNFKKFLNFKIATKGGLLSAARPFRFLLHNRKARLVGLNHFFFKTNFLAHLTAIADGYYKKTQPYRAKIKKLYSLLNTTSSSFFLITPYNSKSSTYANVPKKHLFFYVNKLKKLAKCYNIKNYANIKNILNFKTPYFSTLFGTPFTLSRESFLYLTDNFIIDPRKKRIFVNFKKNSFSFLLGNDIYKFIIKRYLKNQPSPLLIEEGYPDSALLKAFSSKRSSLRLEAHNFFPLSNRPSLYNLSNRASPTIFKTLDGFDWDARLNYETSLAGHVPLTSIRRVKFKPGYMTIWRQARSMLQKIFHLSFKYQYKLTKYLSKLVKFVKFKIILFREMRLDNIVLKSRLIPDKTYTTFFIDKGLIYLNGTSCENGAVLLFMGDFVQMLINLKYYIVYRWLLNWSIKKKIKLKIKTRQKNSPARFNDEKIRSFIFPDWILQNKNLIDDVSKFVEVDYFTLSIVILYEPFLLGDFNVYTLLTTKHHITNLYNWKYIT